jgi:hypothetical protein
MNSNANPVTPNLKCWCLAARVNLNVPIVKATKLNVNYLPLVCLPEVLIRVTQMIPAWAVPVEHPHLEPVVAKLGAQSIDAIDLSFI